MTVAQRLTRPSDDARCWLLSRTTRDGLEPVLWVTEARERLVLCDYTGLLSVPVAPGDSVEVLCRTYAAVRLRVAQYLPDYQGRGRARLEDCSDGEFDRTAEAFTRAFERLLAEERRAARDPERAREQRRGNVALAMLAVRLKTNVAELVGTAA